MIIVIVGMMLEGSILKINNFGIFLLLTSLYLIITGGYIWYVFSNSPFVMYTKKKRLNAFINDYKLYLEDFNEDLYYDYLSLFKEDVILYNFDEDIY